MLDRTKKVLKILSIIISMFAVIAGWIVGTIEGILIGLKLMLKRN
jgi:hypothetical protein